MNKKLHILFLCSWYPSRVIPANGDFIQRHAQAVALQHQVSVFHIISDKNLKNNIEIVIERQNGVESYIAYIKSTKNPFLKTYLFFKAYTRIIEKIGNFDLVHLNALYPLGIFAILLKWFQKKSFIISEHWHLYHKPYCKDIPFWQRYISKQIASRASVICPVTDHLADSMQEFGFKNKYKVVPNVVDTHLFKPAKKTENTFNLIHVSSMDSVKNIPSILKVISELQTENIDFKFYLIGNNCSEFEELVNKLNINENNIILIDQIPQKDLVPYLQQADVFILFSSIENSPCVILESFACGVPVISTNVGGISENFPANFGTLIPRNDSKAMLKSIIQYYDTPRKVSKKEMHRYIVENFNKLAIAKQFTQVYLSVLQF